MRGRQSELLVRKLGEALRHGAVVLLREVRLLERARRSRQLLTYGQEGARPVLVLHNNRHLLPPEKFNPLHSVLAFCLGRHGSTHSGRLLEPVGCSAAE